MTATGLRAAILGLLVLVGGAPGRARAAEECHYTGNGDYDAKIALTTLAERHGRDEDIRVLWRLSARAFVVFNLEYWVDEVSHWHDGVLQSVGLNIRYFVNGRILKQSWDVFDRTAEGFAAWRVQGKTPDIIAAKHGSFVAQWDPARFGRPWLEAYRGANPERRTDLDLHGGEAPPDLVPPFAVAFYLARGASMQTQRTALFLPGNKQQNRVDIPITAQTAAAGAHVWQVPLDSEKLGIRRGSVAFITISAAQQLELIRFRVAGLGHSAQGSIMREGCTGTTTG
jgi:hypothetical protein